MLVRALLVVLALGAACVLYGVLIERRWYRLNRYRLDILPAGAPAELTVLHLSDLHVVRRDRALTRFLASLPKPDVCVVTGDFLAEPEAVDRAVAAVRPVRGRHASWFVLGSNDLFVPRPLNYLKYFRKSRKPRRSARGLGPELIASLEADGWRYLHNERVLADIGDLPVELLGLDDAHIGWHDLRVAPREDAERLGVAVMHSPDSAPETAALGYDLIFAGHTHGGQVRLPLFGALVTNSHLPRRLVSGLSRIGRSYMHVSQGLGTSKFAPFRFFCRPEATVLELRPRAAPQR